MTNLAFLTILKLVIIIGSDWSYINLINIKSIVV